MAAKDQSFGNLPIGAKIFVLVLLLGILGAVYYFVFHMPLEDEIAGAEARHTQLQQEEREAGQRQQDYLRLSQELANREAIDRQNKRILPAEAEIPSFLQDLNRLAELSGLRIALVEPRPEETQELYVRLPVNLSLSGKFHQIAKFFYNVSQLERAINMENVTLTEPEIQGDEVILECDVLATTFRRPPDGAPAAPGTPGAAPAPGAPPQ
jgi:type IV pilus assembly protein PilO